MIALRCSLVMKGIWFAQRHFFLIAACLLHAYKIESLKTPKSVPFEERL